MTGRLKVLSTFFLFAAMATHCYAQNEERDSSIFDRFSIELMSSYHYAPWKQLNDSYSALQNGISYYPVYSNPSGSYQKILGDVSYEGGVLFRFFEHISFVVSGSYLQTSSNAGYLAHFPDFAGVVGTFANNQSLRLNVRSAGGGFRYQFDFPDHISLTFTAIVERSFGRMGFSDSGRVIYTETNVISGGLFTTEMKSNIWSGEISAGASVPFYGPVSIYGEIDYRLMKFPGFNGTGYFSYANTVIPHTSLTSADGFFGVSFTRPFDDEQDFGYYRDPYFGNKSIKPTSLDLSGFGGSIGIKLDF